MSLEAVASKLQEQFQIVRANRFSRRDHSRTGSRLRSSRPVDLPRSSSVSIFSLTSPASITSVMNLASRWSMNFTPWSRTFISD